MPFGMQSFTETQPIAQATTFTSADTTVAKSIEVNQGVPNRVDEIVITSDDTAAIVVDVFLRTSATNTLLGSVTVPAGSGHAGVKPVLFFESLAFTNFNGINLTGAQSLQAACEATMTAAKTMVITVLGGLF